MRRPVMKNICCVFVGSMVFFALALTGSHSEEGGTMRLKSPAFEHNTSIPSRFTCEGDDINPALIIEDVPKTAQSLALIMDDPDAPMGTWVHWVVFNIPVSTRIEENSAPGTLGMNTARKLEYHGPCPPSGTHRYFFKLYALDTILTLKEGASKAALEKAMEGHTIDKAELIGLYKKLR